jgi:hypothetical protein
MVGQELEDKFDAWQEGTFLLPQNGSLTNTPTVLKYISLMIKHLKNETHHNYKYLYSKHSLLKILYWLRWPTNSPGFNVSRTEECIIVFTYTQN